MRRVSGLERIWLAAERIHAPFANCFVLERGFEAERLRRAVGLVSAAHPGARVVRRGRRWVVGDAPIPVREGPVDPDAPLIAPCEVVAEPTRTAIRSRHAVMDGGCSRISCGRSKGRRPWAQKPARPSTSSWPGG